MPSIRTAAALLKHGLIREQELPEMNEVARQYAVAITPAMQHQIVHPDDPVARQFVPSGSELVILPEELGDPIADAPFTPIKGITHRYPDRVLLKITHMCPVYCRFCFRRELVGPGQQMLNASELDAAFELYPRSPTSVGSDIFWGRPIDHAGQKSSPDHGNSGRNRTCKGNPVSYPCSDSESRAHHP